MNTRFAILRAALAVGTSFSLFACGGARPPPTSPTPVDEAVKGIIGGVDAYGPQLNAIGTVGMKNAQGEYQYFCSATLIGPKTVLTAKHCAIVTGPPPYGPMKLVNLVPIYFAVGPDAAHPLQVVEAIAADTSPVNEGGLVDLGNDVAVYHLLSPVEGVTPMKVGPPLTADQVGTKFASVGYGVQYNDGFSGTRKAGAGTLRALEGQAFQLMFSTWEAFRAYFVEQYGEAVVEEFEAELRAMYDDTPLLKDYEAFVGNAAGDAQTCFGDSGGPLVGKVNVAGASGAASTERQVFGVVSGGLGSSQMLCAYGGTYATLGPKTQELIAAANDYQDPCVGFDAQGVCSGTVSTRCADKWEGDRRLLSFDCADLDQVCGRNAAGQVACLDPQEATDAGVSVDGGSAPVDAGTVTEGGQPFAPTIEQVREMVNRDSRTQPSFRR